jgi:hypothetical protein
MKRFEKRSLGYSSKRLSIQKSVQLLSKLQECLVDMNDEILVIHTINGKTLKINL